MGLMTKFGPPGTGKTTYLARQIKRAVERFGPGKVLVASLTTTAAHEIASRDIPVDKHNVGTLHALCYRALGCPTIFETKLTEFNAATGHNLTQGAKVTLDDKPETPMGDGDDDRLGRLSMFRLSLKPDEEMPLDLVPLHDSIEAYKETYNLIDFTDMILRALDEIPVHPADPAAIFYDEAQDGSVAELALIRQWGLAADHCIVCGDDDQTLYSWRGASVEGFLNFTDNTQVLSTTYRLPVQVWGYAEKWVQQIAVRVPKNYKPQEGAPDGLVSTCAASLGSCGVIVNHIKENPDSTVMILASCGYMLTNVMKTLRNHAIPFHNPFRESRGDWNPLKRGGKKTTATDRVLAFMKGSIKHDEPEPWNWEDVHAWVAPLAADSLRRGGKKAIADRAKLTPQLVADPTVLDQLIGAEATEAAEEGDLVWYLENTLKTKAKALGFAIAVAERHGVAALAAEPKVIVSTIHGVKGGEADDVFLFPDLSAKGWQQYVNVGSRDPIYRMFYVGITRSKGKVFLCRKKGTAVKWLPIDRKVESNEEPF